MTRFVVASPRAGSIIARGPSGRFPPVPPEGRARVANPGNWIFNLRARERDWWSRTRRGAEICIGEARLLGAVATAPAIGHLAALPQGQRDEVRVLPADGMDRGGIRVVPLP